MLNVVKPPFAGDKNALLKRLAEKIEAEAATILEANQKDIALAREANLANAFVERLTLNAARVKAMSESCLQIANLPDIDGEFLDSFYGEKHILIKKIRVPLGVVGVIFESRPNVVIDAFALCFKAGNSVILKGGKEALNSNLALANVIKSSLNECGFDENLLCMSEDAGEILNAVGVVDCVIARGGAGLIEFVKNNAKVPFLETGVGNCSIYVDESADLHMALQVLTNAKTSRVSVCNATENLLVHEAVAARFFELLHEEWDDVVEIYGCCETAKHIKVARIADENDYKTEFLDYKLSVKVVKDVDEAIEFINKFGTKHSEVIITTNAPNAKKFCDQVDAAALYVNASSRFTDGGCFGFGGEIGISTQKLHARGPMGLKELTSYKYIITGEGQVR